MLDYAEWLAFMQATDADVADDRWSHALDAVHLRTKARPLPAPTRRPRPSPAPPHGAAAAEPPCLTGPRAPPPPHGPAARRR